MNEPLKLPTFQFISFAVKYYWHSKNWDHHLRPEIIITMDNRTSSGRGEPRTQPSERDSINILPYLTIMDGECVINM